MTDELRKRMDSLRAIAPRLNKATDTAAAVITKIEAFLSSLSVGIEGRSYHHDERPDPDAEPDKPQVIRSALAYGRINGKFAIHVVRETWTKNTSGYPDNSGEDNSTIISEERVAWSSVGRQEKLKAFATIEYLLKQIERNADEVEEQANEASAKMNELLATLEGVTSEGEFVDLPSDGVVYRPNQLKREFSPRLHDFEFFKVQMNDGFRFAYHCYYYPHVQLVLDDVLRNIKQEQKPGEQHPDFAIWWDKSIVATVHRSPFDDDQELEIRLFDDEFVRGAPSAVSDGPPRTNWPTRDEWLADGGDKIIPRTIDPVTGQRVGPR